MNPLDVLLRDAMTEHTEAVPHLRPGSARRALVTSRRRRRATMVAATTTAVAATAGVGAFAVHLQPAGSSSLSPGGGPSAATSPSLTSAAPSTAVPGSVGPTTIVTATPPQAGHPFAQGSTGPTAGATAGVGNYGGDEGGRMEPESAAPAELRAVTLPGPVAGLTVTGEPGGTQGAQPSYMLLFSGKWSKWYWFAPGNTQDSSGAVIITRGEKRPLWNQSQSPSPAVAPTTVNQRAGTVWRSGGDREIYFTAGDLTVEVFVSDKNITLAQMQAIGDAVQGLPQ